MDIERLIAALAPAQVVALAPTEIGDLAYDTRAVTAGALFFCVPGMRADGHDFAAEAVERGAVALVVERPLGVAVPQLVVADTRAAMAVAADEYFGRPTEELAVAGVTGTSGKTTTAFLLYAVLAAAGRRPGLLGTVETRVDGERRPATRTTAEAIDLQRLFREMLDAGDRSCAIEATSHGSQLRRLDRVRFAVLVFTNLSQDHLDFHPTMDDYFEAKRRLFFGDAPPPAAVNVADEYGRRLADELRAVGTPLVTFGFADDEIAAGIESVGGVPGRFETLEEGQPFTVVVDYAHKPAALDNVLRAARELAEGRVLCVFGCGGDRDAGKRPLMGRIAAQLADIPIVTSDNPRSEDPVAIAEAVVAGMDGEPAVELDRRAAIVRAIELAEPGDVVVIAGKGHERGQEIAGRVIPFDDREVASEALRALRATA